ncbi:MAG: hypothetical protein F6K58_13680 [Symploca sp. SIO2E9]|nr:hypothetical protein [Symploca sp. SIO2E9]
MGRRGDGETRRWGDAEMGRGGDGETRRWGDEYSASCLLRERRKQGEDLRVLFQILAKSKP